MVRPHYFNEVCLLAVLTLVGCSSARMSDREPDLLFRRGQYEAAAAKLQEGLVKQGPNGRDSLLYLLDLGLALHAQGKYDESIRIFQQADKLAEIKDYTSLAAETTTLVVSENLKDYKVEDFENVLISTYLAMDYAMIGKSEDALVEARRVNRKLQLMVDEGKRKYKQNAFARYLSAILYEKDHNYNDAYLDYKKTWELSPHFPGLGRDLWRCALILGIHEDMKKWDKFFNLTAEDHTQAKLLRQAKHKGEIIVIYENGISPMKRPNPSFQSLPKFYPRYNPVSFAAVEVNEKEVGRTAILENIEATAIENLDEKYGGLIAKKAAGLLVKAGIGYMVAQQTRDTGLGILAGLLLNAADQADLRSWYLLPRDLQIFRIPVDPGFYTVRVRPHGDWPIRDWEGAEKKIQVSADSKVFVNFRYVP